MRYFSQLTRETTARVMPSRRPLWLRSISDVAEETTVDWPAPGAVAPSSPIGQSVPLPDNGGAPRVAPRLGHAGDPVRPQATVPAPRLSLPTPAAEGRRARAQPEPDFPRAVEPGRRDGDRASVALASPIPASREQSEPKTLPAIAPSGHPTQVQPPGEREPMPATLQGIISELTRRQQELERRYQADQIAAHSGPTQTGLDRVEAQTAPADEGVFLNIGSIVVQVEPEQVAPKTPPKPSPRRVPREHRNDWKRSFLDR